MRVVRRKSSFDGRSYAELGVLLRYSVYRRCDDATGAWEQLEGQINDVVEAQGFLNGSEVSTLTLQSSHEAFRAVQAGLLFDTPIDTFRLEEMQATNSALIMDNVVFSQVPEPASVSLMTLAGPALLLRRRRRSLTICFTR